MADNAPQQNPPPSGNKTPPGAPHPSLPQDTPYKKTTGPSTHPQSHLKSLPTQRPQLERNARKHMLASPPSSWFDHYVPSDEKGPWSATMASTIKAVMQNSNKQLGSDGFTQLKKAYDKKGACENDTYAVLEQIAEEVKEATEKVPGKLDWTAQTVFKVTPNQPTRNDVDGPNSKPDARNILISEDGKTGSPSDTPISKLTTDCAAHWEFKRHCKDTAQVKECNSPVPPSLTEYPESTSATSGGLPDCFQRPQTAVHLWCNDRALQHAVLAL